MRLGTDATILLATDGSTSALRAYRYAASLALELKARLLILNVLPTVMKLDTTYPVNALYIKQLQNESKAELEQLTQRVQQDGVQFRLRQVLGDPGMCIVDMAEEEAAALIVMGTHGRTGLDRLFLGSTAETVVRQARCPVMAVRGSETDTHSTSGGFLRADCSILVPFDFSDCAREAFEFAVSIAKPLQACIRLIHAFEPSAYPLDFSLFHVRDEKALHAKAREHLQQLVTVLGSQGISAEVICEFGPPAEVILAEASKTSASLILMGTHGRRAWEHLAFGSVAEHVVRHAACPVLTVKSPKYPTAHSVKTPSESKNATES